MRGSVVLTLCLILGLSDTGGSPHINADCANPRLGTVLVPLMANLNPLKYCFHGQHSRPRATFRTLPGVKNKREVCAECFEKIMADRKQKKKLR